jgi:hypothetical protein
MTLRQPTFGHGGNARFDEEVTMVMPNKVSNARQPIVFDVMASATDEELDELAIAVVAELDRQAAEQHTGRSAEADRRGAK